MSISIGDYQFERAAYDDEADVLYLRSEGAGQAVSTHATPEGHAVQFDESGRVIGMTLVNARWLLDREGRIVISVPARIETSADELAAVIGRAMTE
jgi:uncharacterized protein YuzE